MRFIHCVTTLLLIAGVLTLPSCIIAPERGYGHEGPGHSRDGHDDDRRDDRDRRHDGGGHFR